jgi:predicted phage terminase large subunit-like protein
MPAASLTLTKADWQAIEREACRRSLAEFVRCAWHVVEPGQPYVHGWHIDAIAEHLEAISRGEITRLLINVPPGTMKSLMTAVFWPAWEMGPQGRPHTRIVAASHSETLAIRDNRRCRNLIKSDWYQELWGDAVQLVSDQNEKKKFETTATGFRQAIAFTGTTGVRGDRFVIDDPMSVDDASSDTKRDAINTTFAEAITTRLNNPDRSAIVVIMQRLHEKDVSGLILSRELGYEHLMLPMEFEPDRACRTSIGFTDPRTQDGELLFPERFSREVVERDKRVMGSYATAGQFQQRPAPREGGMFKRAWFEIVPAAPAGGRSVRVWDLALTQAKQGSDPDYTAGLRMKKVGGVYYVEHVIRDRLSPDGVERLIQNTASQDGREVAQRLPAEVATGGAWPQRIVKLLAGYDARIERELTKGKKDWRATPVSAQAEAGNVKLVKGAWNDAFLDEVCVFPAGAHDDQVDVLSGAFNALTKPDAPPLSGSSGWN